MHQILEEGPASSTQLNTSSVSPSNRSTRKVRLSDRELIQRVQRVAIPERRVDLGKLSSKRGWKRVRIGVTNGMKVHFRVRHAQSRQCQVLGEGEIRTRISKLLALVRDPSESESNALLRALYGSHFIYTSLLHAIPNTERGSLVLSPGTNRSAMGQQLMVRTVSFAHQRLAFYPRPSTSVASTSMTASESSDSSHQVKNEQCCYIELLTPTQEGFQMSFCTLDAADVLAGKAPSDRVISLHPISGWLIAEPSPRNPETLRITFQAAFLGNVPGDWKRYFVDEIFDTNGQFLVEYGKHS
ncbi:unnamed protein product [Peronospora effusa]|nr:unnamed protein product [Peronospora effusa]